MSVIKKALSSFFYTAGKKLRELQDEGQIGAFELERLVVAGYEGKPQGEQPHPVVAVTRHALKKTSMGDKELHATMLQKERAAAQADFDRQLVEAKRAGGRMELGAIAEVIEALRVEEDGGTVTEIVGAVRLRIRQLDEETLRAAGIDEKSRTAGFYGFKPKE